MISKYKDFVKNLFKKKEKVLTKKERFIKDAIQLTPLLEMRFRFIESDYWGTTREYDKADTEDDLLKKMREGKIRFDNILFILDWNQLLLNKTRLMNGEIEFDVPLILELMVMKWMFGDVIYKKYIDKTTIYTNGKKTESYFTDEEVDYKRMSRQLDTLFYKLGESGISEADIKFEQRYGGYQFGPYIKVGCLLDVDSLVALINLIWVEDLLTPKSVNKSSPVLSTRYR